MDKNGDGLLKIPRIFVFALVLSILEVALGVVMALIHVSVTHGVLFGKESSTWAIINYFANATVVVMFFVWFGRVQTIAPYVHAFFVVALSELFAITVFVVFLGEFNASPAMIFEYPLMVLFALVGTGIGIRRVRGKDSGAWAE